MAIQQLFKQPVHSYRPDALPDSIRLLRPLPDLHVPLHRNTLRLRLLGAPNLERDGGPVLARTRKALALLAYLAVQGGQHPREHLADLLWPEADMEDARASLRTTLSYIRQALEPDADHYLAASRESVGLRPSAPLGLDVHDLAEARALLRQAPDSRMLRGQVEAAVEGYRGPFLADLSLPDAPDFEAWVEGQRAHWRGVAAELLQNLATLQLQDSDVGAALTTLERWTSMDPDEESPWQQLIELHLRCEDRAGARRAWQRYREVLAELGADPSPKMTALAERVDGSAASTSQVIDPAAGPGTLDAGSLPFVGRSNEWSALLAAFERCRMGRPEVVVVEGAAGQGKTRLVSQFLRAAKAQNADVVMGRAIETIGDLPCAAVVDALRARLDEENAPDDLLSDLWLGELTRLLPELRERYPDLPVSMPDPALGSGRIFEAVVRLGQALGARKPVVFCLDDVQWTDAATRDFLRYAIRRWTDTGTPILIILVVRSDDLDTDRDLVYWLAALERDTPAVQLTLEPLKRDDVVTLVASITDSLPVMDEDCARARTVREFGIWLAGRAGGCPASLAHAVRVLLDERVLRIRAVGDGSWTVDIPDIRHVQHSGRLNGADLAAACARTDDKVRSVTGFRTRAAPSGRLLYPTAATQAMHRLVEVADQPHQAPYGGGRFHG